MAIALIDNSTLTSIQRIIGEIQLKSKDTFDGDLSAFESFVHAILFYDDIVAINDYKDSFKDQRSKVFPCIRFLDPNMYGIPEATAGVENVFEELIPSIEGGKIKNPEIEEFLKLLKVNIICTWDMSSSVYFLTMKMLGQPDSVEFQKYGKVAASIFSELQDASESGKSAPYLHDVRLVDRFGKPIKQTTKLSGYRGKLVEQNGMTGALNSFIAALRWGLHRTIFYSKISAHLKSDLFLHPIRQPANAYFVSCTNEYKQTGIETISQHGALEATKCIESVLNAGNSKLTTKMRMPFFLAWLINQVDRPDQIIEKAIEIRMNDEFRAARDQLKEINNLRYEGNHEKATQQILKIEKSLDVEFGNILSRYGFQIPGIGIQTASIVKVVNSALGLCGKIKIPEIAAGSFKIPEVIRDMFTGNSTGIVYRNITNDLLNFPQMSSTRDKLASQAMVDRDAITYNPKCENPIYADKISSFKIPM